MNKEEFIKLYNKIVNGTINKDELTKLFMEYCVTEHNKDVEKSKVFISTIIYSVPVLISTYIEYIIQYFSVKFNICTILSKDLIDGQRKILLIY